MVKSKSNQSDQDPITKADFQEAMQMIASAFEKVATKEDLKAFATKDDLIALEQRMGDKFAAKDDLIALEERMSHEFNAIAENIHLDVAGANKDEISLIRNTQELHNERINVIEKQLHLS